MSEQVTVSISTFNKSHTAEVSLDRGFSVSDLIDAAKKNWALPGDVQYHVLNDTRGCQLQAKQRLSPDVVGNNDTLIIQPVLVAGGVREDRLTNDYSRLCQLCDRSQGQVQILSTSGTPPHSYRLKFKLRSISHIDNARRPVYIQEQVALVSLPENYPIANKPNVSLERPLFHPHVFDTGSVCIGQKQIVGEFLDKFVERLASIIVFDPKYFDFNSPANRTAMDWVRQMLSSSPSLFPTDTFLPPPTTSERQMTWKNL